MDYQTNLKITQERLLTQVRRNLTSPYNAINIHFGYLKALTDLELITIERKREIAIEFCNKVLKAN